jgi:hypothetical protein
MKSRLSEANEGKSADSFCRQVSAWFPDLICNFYLVKNCKIVQNLTTTQAREQISTSLEFLNVCLTKFKKNQILLNKISHRILLAIGPQFSNEDLSHCK